MLLKGAAMYFETAKSAISSFAISTNPFNKTFGSFKYSLALPIKAFVAPSIFV